MDNFKMEPNFLFLNRAFWLLLCCISRFQLHLRPRLAQTEEIGERANIESDSYSPRKYRFVDDILQINECIENSPATIRDRLTSVFFVPLRIHNFPFTLIHNDKVFMQKIINLLLQNPEARIPERVTSDLLAVPVYRL